MAAIKLVMLTFGWPSASGLAFLETAKRFYTFMELGTKRDAKDFFYSNCQEHRSLPSGARECTGPCPSCPTPDEAA
jgi:hypothetical protein